MRPLAYLIDAGWFRHGAGGGFLQCWDPSPAEFERWLHRLLARGATLVDITVHDVTFP